MKLQNKLKILGEALSEIVDSYHYYRPVQNLPYLIWQEQAESNFISANNKKIESSYTGSIDYFTKLEYDPIIDRIEKRLNELQSEMSFTYNLESVQFENETSVIHYEWSFEI